MAKDVKGWLVDINEEGSVTATKDGSTVVLITAPGHGGAVPWEALEEACIQRRELETELLDGGWAIQWDASETIVEVLHNTTLVRHIEDNMLFVDDPRNVPKPVIDRAWRVWSGVEGA